ncbi:MAG TPA: RDD family protein [Chitinophagales bacterium]|nr:RDD family protein [Chitinophagales bacterium]HNE46425.1 RDD family protein [Chitinophagales bacterium]HNI54193.1 RDD family protein [Chitinophagales bacterium]
MDENILDQHEVEQSSYQLAGFWDRFLASLIDGLIFIPVTGLAFYNMMTLKILPLALILGLLFIIYKVYMEAARGATIGKRAMGIRVVTMDYQPINSNASLARNSLFALNAVVGLVNTVMLFNAINFENTTGFMDYITFQNTNSLQLANLIGLVVFISGLWIAFDKNKQGLHDKIGKTLVIKD